MIALFGSIERNALTKLFASRKPLFNDVVAHTSIVNPSLILHNNHLLGVVTPTVLSEVFLPSSDFFIPLAVSSISSFGVKSFAAL